MTTATEIIISGRPAYTFEANGWAVAHVTTLWRSFYAIAVRRFGEITTIMGGYDEPLSFLLARYDAGVLAGLQEGSRQDMPRLGDGQDLDWEAKDRAIRRVADWVRLTPEDERGVPVPYEEGIAELVGL